MIDPPQKIGEAILIAVAPFSFILISQDLQNVSGIGLQVEPCLSHSGQGQTALGRDEIPLGFIEAH